VAGFAFPFLPRHLTLVGAITIGIPSFFLALAPNTERFRPGFVERVLRFAIPTGLLAAVATFVGAQGQDVLPYYYSAADVVVMPSHYESFGLVALEAMACGTPVVASDVGGLSYTVEDGVTGFLVPQRNPLALADRICDILNDGLFRDQLGRQALAVAQRYSWQQIADQIVGVYREVAPVAFEKAAAASMTMVRSEPLAVSG